MRPAAGGHSLCGFSPERRLETQVEGGEYQDNANVSQQSCPKVMPEKHDVDADNHSDKREHVDSDSNVFPHVPSLMRNSICDVALTLFATLVGLSFDD